MNKKQLKQLNFEMVKMNKIQKGTRVSISGSGRTAHWPNNKGTVTKKRGNSIFVNWDGTCFEDEMSEEEVKLITKKVN